MARLWYDPIYNSVSKYLFYYNIFNHSCYVNPVLCMQLWLLAILDQQHGFGWEEGRKGQFKPNWAKSGLSYKIKKHQNCNLNLNLN
jgi:hypothetical protein